MAHKPRKTPIDFDVNLDLVTTGLGLGLGLQVGTPSYSAWEDVCQARSYVQARGGNWQLPPRSSSFKLF